LVKPLTRELRWMTEACALESWIGEMRIWIKCGYAGGEQEP
jgi:hypothetical protein